MPWGDPRAARLLVAGALLTAVLLQVVRVWLPSLVLVPVPDGRVPGLVLTAVAAVCLALPVTAAGLLPVVRTARALLVTGGGLVLARLVLQLTDGGWPQLGAASVGTVAGALALVAWAVRTDGHTGRLALLIGIVADAVTHLALGTLDLVWRQGAGGLLVVIALVLATWVATVRAATSPPVDTTASGTSPGPAWPWLAIGPALVLVFMVSAVPGRAALGTGWSPSGLAGVLAGAHVLGVVAALAGPRLGAVPCGTVGAGLVLLGTAGALQPAGALTAVAQVVLAVGTGLAIGGLANVSGRADARRTAITVAGSWLLAVLLVAVSHAWPELPTRVDGRYLLVLAAALLGALALGGARRATPMAARAPRPRRVLTAAATIAAVGLLTAAATALTLPRPAPWPGPDDEPADATSVPTGGAEVAVALLNVQSGYDERARYAPLAQADALASMGPDLVALNEVDRGWLLTGGNDTLRLLADRFGREPLFSPTGAHLTGHALLTDLPVDEAQSSRLPRGLRSAGEGLLSTVVELDDGRPLAVLSTQLHRDEAQADVRRRQARAVAAEVARLRGRDIEVVLLGDLQAEPRDAELEPLEDLLSHAVPRGHATWPARRPQRQLDHIMVSPGVQVVSWEVGDQRISDHLPVTARLRLTPVVDETDEPG